MRQKTYLIAGSLIILVIFGFQIGCQRKILYSRDKEMPPVSQRFDVSPEQAYRISQAALEQLEYSIERTDETALTLQTHWISTKPSSHYIDLFGHEDYGTVSAYYRIELKVEPQEGAAVVTVSAPVRSVIIRRMRTSQREEKKILRKIADLIRREDFELSNVGAKE